MNDEELQEIIDTLKELNGFVISAWGYDEYNDKVANLIERLEKKRTSGIASE